MLKRKLLAATAALFVILTTPGQAGKRAQVSELSEVEVEDLVFMREEEKLAHDVYANLYRYYKDNGIELLIFANIARSEQLHMDAMLRLLNKYDIEDPAAETAPGEFINPVLSDLYDSLVSDREDNVPILDEPASGGRVNPEAGLQVGAWIEERDMIDILHSIEHTNQTDIVGVYTNLLCGSRDHLRAFVGRIGEDKYVPQLLYPDLDSGVPAVETLEFWLSDESDEICM